MLKIEEDNIALHSQSDPWDWDRKPKEGKEGRLREKKRIIWSKIYIHVYIWSFAKLFKITKKNGKMKNEL